MIVRTSFTRTVVGTIGMAVCAGLCLVGATAPAAAATVRSMAVSYADLDLARAAGRATLARRIDAAAQAVCASSNIGPAAALDEAQCIRGAVIAARAKVAVPVTAAAL